jgi:hypothetical protein
MPDEKEKAWKELQEQVLDALFMLHSRKVRLARTAKTLRR